MVVKTLIPASVIWIFTTAMGCFCVVLLVAAATIRRIITSTIQTCLEFCRTLDPVVPAAAEVVLATAIYAPRPPTYTRQHHPLPQHHHKAPTCRHRFP